MTKLEMIQRKIHNFSITLDNNILKVENNNKLCRIELYNRSSNWFGYVNSKFDKNTWISSNLKDWGCNNICEIKITTDNEYFEFEVDLVSNKILDITPLYVNVKSRFEIEDKKISILIAAYNTVEYIDSTINELINIKEKNWWIDLEIIIAIDGCYKTLKHFSTKVYPDYCKIILLSENHGLSIVKNTLVKIAKNEKLIFLDSDDLPVKHMIDRVWNELDDNDFIYFKCYRFENDKDIPNNIKKYPAILGGCFGLNKSKFLKLNGFWPWRAQSDSEFKERLQAQNTHNKKKNKFKVLDDYLFYYRDRANSLSRDSSSNKHSEIRKAYYEIMDNRRKYVDYSNPNALKTAKYKIIQ